MLDREGHQRHPTAVADIFAWVEDDHIGFWKKEEKPIWFEAYVVDRLALTEKHLCWSQRGEDIDIHCRDGFVLKRKKHQLWPSIWSDYLIFREEGQLMLYRFNQP